MQEERIETELMLAVPHRERHSSVGSLRPVDLSVRRALERADGGSKEEDISGRRRRLARVVFGTVGACGVILAAAVVRVAFGTEPNSAVAARPSAAREGPAVQAVATTPAPAAAHDSAPPAPAIDSPRAAVAPTTGTLVFERPAAPGRVWLDGEKLVVEHPTVACGRHEIRIGARGRTHPIDIPCGGELRISRW